MKSWIRLTAAALLAAAIPCAFLALRTLACGPDWEPEVFVPEHHPEKPERFADGHLGILQRGYYHADLVVAYRYLSGGKLTDKEKASYKTASSESGDGGYSGAAVELWRQARAQNGGQAQNYNEYIQQERMFKKTVNGATEIDFELNCPDAAFVTAAATITDRAAKWGKDSQELREWLRGQDAVFSNCSKDGHRPDEAKPDWPVLLRQDRAYQLAAAEFYAADYDGAIRDFEGIGRDSNSPWSKWGEYLAARAEIRKAASVAKPAGSNEMASFDPQWLITARNRLLRVEKQSTDEAIRNSASGLLGFIAVRLDPGARLDDVSAGLAAPNGDPNFDSDLADFNYLADRGVSGSTDLPHWVEQFQNIQVAQQPMKPAQAVERWQQRPTLPWLIAALAMNQDAVPQQLQDAAAAVKPASPGYETVAYLRTKQMLIHGQTNEARALLTSLLAGADAKEVPSTRNALLQARMPTARNLTEFLFDAPRTVIGDPSSEAAGMAQCPEETTACQPRPIPPLQFDADAAAYLNLQMPLATLEAAAQNPALPEHLRQAIAIDAWVRALGLGNAESARRMAKLLPPPMRQAAGESDGFPATLELLRAPGARPFLDRGVQRSASYANLDHYRDNWWCGRWSDNSPRPGSQSYGAPRIIMAPLPLLTSAERQEAAREAEKLDALPQGLVWVAHRAIDYVKAHPGDKDAPEALALIVHGTRYGCAEYTDPKPQHEVSKAAFELLHHKYPNSIWAQKTKYYY